MPPLLLLGRLRWVSFEDGDEIHVSGSENDTTNNRMEITAILIGLRDFQNSKYVIYTDSMYSIKCAKREWKRTKNLDLWEQYDILSAGKDISFVWVRGHSGNVYNELADRLSRADTS